MSHPKRAAIAAVVKDHLGKHRVDEVVPILVKELGRHHPDLYAAAHRIVSKPIARLIAKDVEAVLEAPTGICGNCGWNGAWNVDGDGLERCPRCDLTWTKLDGAYPTTFTVCTPLERGVKWGEHGAWFEFDLPVLPHFTVELATSGFPVTWGVTGLTCSGVGDLLGGLGRMRAPNGPIPLPEIAVCQPNVVALSMRKFEGQHDGSPIEGAEVQLRLISIEERERLLRLGRERAASSALDLVQALQQADTPDKAEDVLRRLKEHLR